jgi:hypothetical protein
MKTLFVSLAALMLLFSSVSFASNSNDFSFDETEFYNSFETLIEIDQIVGDNPLISVDELKNVEGLSMEGLEALDYMNSFEPPLGIPSFLWGCVLGWVGILVTYLITDGDKDETKQALIGCVVAGAVYVVFYIVYIVLIVSASTI